MNSTPLISIIVPVYKVEHYLNTCINSVFAQTYKKWEMILVDDGSPDRSGEMCDEYAQRDTRVIVLHKKNGGLSSARNAALDYLHDRDFVTFLDSDDFWHPDFLYTLVKLQQDNDADIVQCGFMHGTETLFPSKNSTVKVHVLNNHEVFLSEKANIVMWGKLYRYNLFENIRMPVGLYNEDDWTTWKIYYRSRTIVMTSQCLYYYTVNPTSIMAKLGKKPDLRYINAYNERISFFKRTGEKDLEHCSRLQLCKSLLLTYCHKQLTNDNRREIKNKFDESWMELKQSPYIKVIYKYLFKAFHVMPMITSEIVNKIR